MAFPGPKGNTKEAWRQAHDRREFRRTGIVSASGRHTDLLGFETSEVCWMRRILVFVGALALPVLAEAEVACLAGEAPGVDPADVETVAQIVCSQLRRQGEQVREASVAQGEHWRVSLRPLGRKVLLSLQHVGENGAVRREGE